MKFKNLLMAVATTCTLMLVGTVNGQEVTVYKMNLNQDHLTTLQSGKSLNSTIPLLDRGSITAILLGTNGSQNEEPRTVSGSVELIGDSAVVTMDDSLIEDVKSQPLRLEVDARPFSQILISYDTNVSLNGLQDEDTSDAQPLTAPEPEIPAKKMFYINLRNNKRMVGEIDGFDTFSIKTGFGDVSMPLEQIAGIRFHTDPKDSAVVILKNGDSLTGIPNVDAVKIKTEWGQADVATEYMEAILTSSNSTFSQGQTDFGTRWQLRNSYPVQPGSRNYNNNRFGR